jgi:hypothetical protein
VHGVETVIMRLFADKKLITHGVLSLKKTFAARGIRSKQDTIFLWNRRGTAPTDYIIN